MKEPAVARETRGWVLRLFAGSWTTLLLLAALLLRHWLPGVAYWWLPLVAALACVWGLFVPAAMAAPYRLVERLFAPLGRIFALVLLTLVFFGVFTPFALVLRLLRWDPLRLVRKRWPASGWRQREALPAADYRWQY